uniref:Endonuclease/exonuclease/phosphatase domain-containing protein n=1 Tax=Kalanchoe fedtschenkoi TaxID=63787 RepID=A0A7N0TV17_KALFE
MLRLLNSKLRRLCSTLRRSIRRRSNPPLVRLVKPKPNGNHVQPHPRFDAAAGGGSGGAIRVATFNAALFSVAPPVSEAEAHRSHSPGKPNSFFSDAAARPKSILKASKLKTCRPKPKLRVSINLPEDEISLLKNMQTRMVSSGEGRPVVMSDSSRGEDSRCSSSRTVSQVLRELKVDILALQDVKADEENDMQPLSDLARALGMNYVFADSWAPQFGNAILSRWPIKKWNVQKLLDNSDFRNVLQATIDVPGAGDVNFYCTHLDHLDEDRRTNQINAITESNGEPHLLAGCLNSLCDADYSTERWTDIVKYYQEIGKPRPRADVMRLMKSKKYMDARDFAGECESVVIRAKGQSVQGTCRYGTRMDYLLASPTFPYEFVPGSYAVYSSQGTSDHHIVKADLVKRKDAACQSDKINRHKPSKVMRMTDPSSSRGVWLMPIK